MTIRTSLAISFYRNPHLVDNIEDVLPELQARDSVHEVILINDSPDHDALEKRLVRLAARPKVFYIRNPHNLGYTKSINQVFKRARAAKTHLICVNSDVAFTADVFDEVLGVSTLDDRIGFVFPRSDTDPNFGLTGFLAESTQERRRRLPRFEFTPTAVGYFLFVCAAVINRFDGFDELFSPGYEEENDLILRAGALGFRAVLANYALVHHGTSSSFSEKAADLKERHHRLLLDRHPYFSQMVQSYINSEQQHLYRVLRGIEKPGSIIIDCYGFPPTLNGTTIYARDLVKAINRLNAQRARDITLLVRQDLFEIMGLQDCIHLKVCHDPEQLKPHFVLIKVGQPFHSETLSRALDKSACSVDIFFDTISQDVVSLRSARIEQIWNDVTHVFRNVVFISNASLRSFEARYLVRGAGMHTVYPSMTCVEYGPSMQRYKTTSAGASGFSRLLLVGNRFPHKDLLYTLNYVLADPELIRWSIDVLTDFDIDHNPRVTKHAAGSLPQDHITQLYSGCDAVLYPSYYEGFGLPLMEALHFSKPVIARHSPLYVELRSLLGSLGRNIHLYKTREQLTDLLAETPKWIDAESSTSHDWLQAGRQILDIADAASASFDFVQRSEAIRVLTISGHHPLMSSAIEQPVRLNAVEQLAWRINRVLHKYPMLHKIARIVYHRLVK